MEKGKGRKFWKNWKKFSSQNAYWVGAEDRIVLRTPQENLFLWSRRVGPDCPENSPPGNCAHSDQTRSSGENWGARLPVHGWEVTSAIKKIWSQISRKIQADYFISGIHRSRRLVCHNCANNLNVFLLYLLLCGKVKTPVPRCH